MKTPDENMDLMIFDYLEGNLKGEKRDQLEQELVTDEILREELGVWKSSYIKGEFYDTSELESGILRKPTSNFTIIAYLNALLIICLSFISSTQSKMAEIVRPLSEPVFAEKLRIKPGIEGYQIVISATVMAPDETAVANELPDETLVRDVANQKEKESLFNITAIENVAVHQPPSPAPPFISLKNKKRIEPETAPKEEKKVRRIKYKSTKNKPEIGFVKGRIPYVVPLNYENF